MAPKAVPKPAGKKAPGKDVSKKTPAPPTKPVGKELGRKPSNTAAPGKAVGKEPIRRKSSTVAPAAKPSRKTSVTFVESPNNTPPPGEEDFSSEGDDEDDNVTAGMSEEEIAIFRKHFNAADRDGGGDIDKSEFRIFIAKINATVDADELFDSVDDDGGGSISFEEFVGVYQRIVQQQMEKAAAKRAEAVKARVAAAAVEAEKVKAVEVAAQAAKAAAIEKERMEKAEVAEMEKSQKAEKAAAAAHEKKEKDKAEKEAVEKEKQVKAAEKKEKEATAAKEKKEKEAAVAAEKKEKMEKDKNDKAAQKAKHDKEVALAQEKKEKQEEERKEKALAASAVKEKEAALAKEKKEKVEIEKKVKEAEEKRKKEQAEEKQKKESAEKATAAVAAAAVTAAVIAPSPPREAKSSGRPEKSSTSRPSSTSSGKKKGSIIIDDDANTFREEKDVKGKGDGSTAPEGLSTGPLLCANCVELISDETYAKNQEGICLHTRCVEGWKYKKQKEAQNGGAGKDAKPSIGDCTQCRQIIPTGVAYLRSKTDDKILLHEKCVEAWKSGQKPEDLDCAQCKKVIEGEYCRLTNPFGETFVLHQGECTEEFQKAVAPTCGSCKKPIVGEGVLVNDVAFHKQCQKDWDGSAPKCGQCDEPCIGAYLQVVKEGGDTVSVHEGCAVEYRSKNAAKCTRCGERITDTTISKISGDMYHTQCASDYIEEQKNKSVGTCAQCDKPITTGKYLQGGEDLFIHEECQEAYQDATAPKCGLCGENITGGYVDAEEAGEEDGSEPVTTSYHEACYDKKLGNAAVDKAKEKEKGDTTAVEP